MKIFKSSVFALTLMLFAFAAKAGTYSYTVNVPWGLCDFEVCATVDYVVVAKGVPYSPQSTTPVCATITIGNSATLVVNTPSNSTFLGVHFLVSSGSFSYTFGTTTESVYANCLNTSNPETRWTNMGSNNFQLWGDFF